MIEIRNVLKSYDGTKVVDDVSVDIPHEAVTAIIGPNGAGKSTLLSVVARLLRADTGTVSVGGLDIDTTPSGDLAKKLAILRQDTHPATRLTVEDFVSFGRYPHSKGRLTTEDQSHIEDALDYLDLGQLRHRFLDELSGGQRQRAFVAMVLAQDTDYVLLDEPLNNLDMKHAVSMMKLMRSMVRELKKTVVIVLHDINFASVYADHLVVMKDGRIAHAGPPDTVVTPDILREVYDLEVSVHRIGGQIISVYYD